MLSLFTYPLYMVRIETLVQRSVKAEPPKAVTLAAKTSTVIIPDLIQQGAANVNASWGYEVVARYIFNDSGAKLYYTVGSDKCDNVNAYHGAIADQTLLNISEFGGGQVSVYSVAGGNVSVTVLHRQDLHSGVNNVGSLPAIRT